MSRRMKAQRTSKPSGRNETPPERRPLPTETGSFAAEPTWRTTSGVWNELRRSRPKLQEGPPAEVLNVKDNLERALQFAESSDSQKGIVEGVRLTVSQLDQLLAQEGVRPIQAEGKPFDPHLHEAVQTVHDPNSAG